MRWAPVALLAAGFLVAGCAAARPRLGPLGSHLTIYTSLPLVGPEAAAARQVERGEELALAAAHGHVGPLTLSLVVLDDAAPKTGSFEPGVVAANARLAAEDPSGVAYIGDLSSPATAVALPITNGGLLLQISPGSPYIGLTASLDAGQDDPNRFFPTGLPTFARLVPSDAVEAEAWLAFLRRRGVRSIYLISSEDPFEIAPAELLAEAAKRAGLAVAGFDRIHLGAAGEPAEYRGEAERVAKSGAEAVLLSLPLEGGAVALTQALHLRSPGLLLLAGHTLAFSSYLGALGAAANRTFVATPYLPLAAYPQARSILAAYSRTYHEPPQSYALYGYEAVELVLAALAKAAVASRPAVDRAFFSLGPRHGVLGSFAVDLQGEASLNRYAIWRVGRGLLRRYLIATMGPQGPTLAVVGHRRTVSGR